MINFNNTENAFKTQSKNDLKIASFLFKTIQHAWLVKCLGILSNLSLKIKIPINWLIKPTLYRHFVGGETLEECIPVAEKMFQSNVHSLLDYSVESAQNLSNINNTFNEILRSINIAKSNTCIPFTVFKPTSLILPFILGKLTKGKELTDEENQQHLDFINRIDTLCAEAIKSQKPILIDAEDYSFQKAIDEVALQMMMKYNKEKAMIFNTLQMYRSDRYHYLEELIAKAKAENFILGCKFVRGAYMEKERNLAEKEGYDSPICTTKANTDTSYNAGLLLAIKNIQYVHIFCGTHNEQSVRILAEQMQQNGILPNDERIFFSQLYGMSDNISFNLAAQGYNVVKYLPYGKVKSILPYLLRRAQENTAIAGQTSRELSFIKIEQKRRNSIS